MLLHMLLIMLVRLPIYSIRIISNQRPALRRYKGIRIRCYCHLSVSPRGPSSRNRARLCSGSLMLRPPISGVRLSSCLCCPGDGADRMQDYTCLCLTPLIDTDQSTGYIQVVANRKLQREIDIVTKSFLLQSLGREHQ